MPTDKRARQRANRQAKVQVERRRAKRRTYLLRGGIVVVVAAAVFGVAYLVENHGSSATTGTTLPPTTATTAPTTTTTAPNTTTTALPAITAALQAAANKKAVAAGCPSSTKTRVNTLSWSSAPPMTIDTSKTYTATVDTTAGTFTITLDPKQAPQTVNNFVFLANKGFYHCVLFHRVIPSFMDQTGDPTGTGTGGPGYTIPDENPKKAANSADQYPLGSVAMANTGSPHSGGSQWFIVAGPEGESLPNTYALFGKVTSGMKVVNEINQQGSTAGVPPDVTQRILSVTIHQS